MSFFDLNGTLKPLTALKQFGKRPHTISYPKESKEAAPRYRGLHYNDLDECIGCGNCSTICQNAAIDMIHIEGIEGKKGDSGLRPRVDNGRCCWCALCVEVCPTGSLSLTKDYLFVSEDPDDFLWTPGKDNPDGKEQISFYSTEEISLNVFNRVPMPELEGKERVKSFAEVVLGYSEAEARAEASRCISCGLCTEVCPEHMHIPEYINAIAAGNDADALRIIYDNNPLPEMCGKVCTRRCEDVCAIATRGEALAIRWLKRYATETAATTEITREIVNPEIREPNGKTVGIIGAGPSGLTAAYYLALRGYDVTIYEANAKAGGATMYGIPKYRFPIESLDKQIEYIKSIGVKIHFNTKVGKDISFKEIYDKYDAVFMGVGFPDAWPLGVEGDDAKGSMQAYRFLYMINSGEKVDIGDKVVVVGGGNVAIDAARVSRRLGADVTILYRRRVEDMPADWEEIEGAEDEGVHIIPQGIPVKIHKDEKGRVKAVEYLKAKMVPDDKGGRPRPVAIEGSNTILEATAVMAAIGQKGDYSFLPEEFTEKIKIERGRFVVNEKQQTGDPKVFAGGDAVNRTADAISAIADGFRACKAIDEMLSGK
ncbi:FAD-dependent oxidoreductase [Candidatus Sulfidibacterium hydrothermale]|uniref:FAD-dependent oxidoreductase n=1 Tax=Candidatus Sulfidibacterium hydrothermale TaxID=2875962 RepID=UPI001F0A4C32|nr:FAD-dependent oxidoreductase [Candidatus Sulfidibacterium hydrothermale]UBM62711.1 FAD-dependent oxidoreductase [Candidatus Sulfidibacterium hydrothermale]